MIIIPTGGHLVYKGILLAFITSLVFWYFLLGIIGGGIESKYEDSFCSGPTTNGQRLIYPSYKIGCELGYWLRH